jgi:arylesterase / paraoxonase
MRSLLKTLALAIVMIVIYIVYLANDAGEFRSIADQHPSQCRAIAGLPGSEDITIHPRGLYAYISSDDRRSVISGSPRPGAIFRYALDGTDAVPINMTPDADVYFRPHGISLYVDSAGRETLFVVNHPGESLFGAPQPSGSDAEDHRPLHTVEIFDVAGERLRHRRTVSGELLRSPNDVVAIDHERFYVSNDHGSAQGLLRQLEDYLRLPWANIVYFDGDSLRVVAEGLSYANGINVSPDSRRLYVAEVSRKRVREYTRNELSGELSELRVMDMGFGVDNIEVDPDSGDLWIGGHARLLTFVRHAADAAVLSPSQVVRVQLTEHAYDVDTVFMDNGELISGASVGAWHNGRLLIGSVFEDHILDCTL